MLLFDEKNHKLYNKECQIFHPKTMSWENYNTPPQAVNEISFIDGVKYLQSCQSSKIRIPIGVIGARNPSNEQFTKAELIGREIAKLGLTILCGGTTGVMEAVCKGASEMGGLTIGVLPEGDPNTANLFVTVPIATGIGVARNSIIAKASLCLVVIGGKYGTFSEIAYGLQFGKKVFGIEKEPFIVGMDVFPSVDILIEKLCEHIFNFTSKVGISSG